MAGERRLYLERNCRLPESPAHSRRRNREGPASSKGLNSQRGFGPAVEPRRKSRPRSTSLHGSSPCKCQRLSTLRWDRLPPSRPSTKSGARAGGRRLSDRRLHRWLAGTSASAPSSHGAADLLGLNRAHICVRNPKSVERDREENTAPDSEPEGNHGVGRWLTFGREAENQEHTEKHKCQDESNRSDQHATPFTEALSGGPVECQSPARPGPCRPRRGGRSRRSGRGGCWGSGAWSVGAYHVILRPTGHRLAARGKSRSY